MSKAISLSVELKESFNRLITKHTGLVIRTQDQASLSEKILIRMKALKLALPENYYQLLESFTTASYQEWQNLIAILTNNESYFFRDRAQLNVLKKYVLPEIISRKEADKTIRICSAGCSTGEEPYSLAILLKEIIPDLKQWNVMILGLDISQTALKQARKAIYSPWSFRGVHEHIKKQYFQNIKNQYHLAHEIKQMVKFKTTNLVKDSWPQHNSELRDMDLIICRNVFIYFESLAIAKVLDKIYHTLQPSGYFLTGHTELYGHNLSQFQTKVFPESLVYQRQEDKSVNQPLVLPPTQQNHPSPKVNQTAPPKITDKGNTNLKKIDFKPKNFPPISKNNAINSSVHPSPVANFNGNGITQKNISGVTQPKNYHLDRSIKTEGDRLEPTNEELVKEAETLLGQESYDLAITQAKKVLQINPHSFPAYHLLAQIHANLGKYEEAIHYCYQALQIDDFSVACYYLLAQIAEEQGKLAEAKQMLKRIIYLEPSSVNAYFELSQIYQQEGDEKRSLKMQQAAFNILNQLPAKK